MVPVGFSQAARRRPELLLLQPLPGATGVNVEEGGDIEVGVRGVDADEMDAFAAVAAKRLVLQDAAGIEYPLILSRGRYDARWERLRAVPKTQLPRDRWYRLSATSDDDLVVGEVAFAARGDDRIDASFFTGHQPRIRDMHLEPRGGRDGSPVLTVAFSEPVEADLAFPSLVVEADGATLKGCATFEGKCKPAPAGATITGFGYVLEAPLAGAVPLFSVAASAKATDGEAGAVAASVQVGPGDWLPCLAAPDEWCWRAPTP